MFSLQHLHSGRFGIIQRIRCIFSITILVFCSFCSFSQPSPIRLSPFVDAADSCIKPIRIIDPLFLPGKEIIRRQTSWEWKTGDALKLPDAEYPFYIMSGVFLFLGLALSAFPKYFDNLSRLFFQSGFRQKSIRDQLDQNKAASLAANILFFVSAGIYLYLLGVQKGLDLPGVWYTGLLASISFLMTIYLVKYLTLRFAGWVFNAGDLANQYAFIIFFVNKITGIFLLPVILILWLGKSSLHPIVLVVSLLALSFLFLYRYFLILPIIRRQSGISSFHFFIYLCTFEILPILLIIKFLVNLLSKSN